jgi:polar amino acid transport system substrate-binding protein
MTCPRIFKHLHHVLILLFIATPSYCFERAVVLTLVTEHRPPYQFMLDGEIAGFSTQLINTMFKHTTYKTNTFMYPWSRAYNVALKKENTCIYAIGRTTEREKSLRWTQAFITTNFTFIGLKSSNDIKLDTIEDAKGYRVAVLRDDVTHQLLKKRGFIENKNMFVVNNPSSMLKLLQSRNLIDMILTDKISFKYRAKFHNVNPALFSEYLKLDEHPIDFYLACSLNTEQVIVDDIIDAFKKIKQTGEYDKIMKRWLNTEDFTPPAAQF